MFECEIDFVAIKVEPEIEYPFERARLEEEQKREKLTVKIDTSKVNMNDLMARIRHHVLIHRIRVCRRMNGIIDDFFRISLGERILRRFRSSSFGYN